MCLVAFWQLLINEYDQRRRQEFATGGTKEGVWGTEVPRGVQGQSPGEGLGEAPRSRRQIMLISSYDGGHAPMYPPWLRYWIWWRWWWIKTLSPSSRAADQYKYTVCSVLRHCLGASADPAKCTLLYHSLRDIFFSFRTPNSICDQICFLQTAVDDAAAFSRPEHTKQSTNDVSGNWEVAADS